jgi:hypothetical protein
MASNFPWAQLFLYNAAMRRKETVINSLLCSKGCKRNTDHYYVHLQQASGTDFQQLFEMTVGTAFVLLNTANFTHRISLLFSYEES